jgi:hypothetical protein
MSPNDRPENAMKPRHQVLVAAVERAINEADPIGLLEIGAPADEYAPEIGTIVPRLASAERPEDVTTLLHEEFIRWFGDDTAGPRCWSTIWIRGVGARDLGRGNGVSTEDR